MCSSYSSATVYKVMSACVIHVRISMNCNICTLRVTCMLTVFKHNYVPSLHIEIFGKCPVANVAQLSSAEAQATHQSSFVEWDTLW